MTCGYCVMLFSRRNSHIDGTDITPTVMGPGERERELGDVATT